MRTIKLLGYINDHNGLMLSYNMIMVILVLGLVINSMLGIALLTYGD